jgi:hypothetical protein
MEFFGRFFGDSKGKEPSNDVYVEQCIFSGLQEGNEQRDGFEMHDVKPASVLGSGYGTEQDVSFGRSLMSKYPDLDMPYYWLSHQYALKGDFTEARAILNRGIEKCKRKRYLCDEYGWLECQAGRLPEAVKWWSRSVILQLTSGKLDSYEPFMYLAYVAEYCRLERQSKKLFEVTDRVRSIRLNATGQQKLYDIVENSNKQSISAVIDLITEGLTKGNIA